MNKDLVQELKDWLKKPGNTCACIAVALGYRDSAPVSQWLRRGRVPSYQAVRVKQIITTGERKK